MEPLSELGDAYRLLKNIKLLMVVIKLALLQLKIADAGKKNSVEAIQKHDHDIKAVKKY